MSAIKMGAAFAVAATLAGVTMVLRADGVGSTGTAVPETVARSTATSTDEHRPADLAFYEAFSYPEGAQTEVYTSLGDALSGATAVVLAQVTDVRVTRLVGPSPAEALPYVGVTIRPIEVLGGSLPAHHSSALTVEFVSVAGDVDDLRAKLPGGHAVWVLRNKSELPAGVAKGAIPTDEREYYRLVSSQGLFVQGERHVVNPLAHEDGPEIPIPGESEHGPARRDPVLVEAERHATLSSFVEYARTV